MTETSIEICENIEFGLRDLDWRNPSFVALLFLFFLSLITFAIDLYSSKEKDRTHVFLLILYAIIAAAFSGVTVMKEIERQEQQEYLDCRERKVIAFEKEISKGVKRVEDAAAAAVKGITRTSETASQTLQQSISNYKSSLSIQDSINRVQNRLLDNILGRNTFPVLHFTRSFRDNDWILITCISAGQNPLFNVRATFIAKPLSSEPFSEDNILITSAEQYQDEVLSKLTPFPPAPEISVVSTENAIPLAHGYVNYSDFPVDLVTNIFTLGGRFRCTTILEINADGKVVAYNKKMYRVNPDKSTEEIEMPARFR